MKLSKINLGAITNLSPDFLKRSLANRSLLIVLLLLVIGLGLRSYHLGDLHNVEPDERAFLMAGTSIIRDGVPTAWIIPWPEHNWDAYWQVTDTNIVTPYLDHPPLFYTGVGLWAYLVGQDDLSDPDWLLLRLPMIAISGLTMLLTFLFVQRAFNTTLALFTLAAYAFFPSAIVTARFLLTDNAITLFLMACLYLMMVHTSSKNAAVKRWSAVLIIVIAGLAPLLKLSGLMVPGAVVLFYFIRRNFRMGWLVLAATLTSLAFLLGFAWFYSWAVFVGAQTSHLYRPQTFEHFWSFFTLLDIGNMAFFDPSLVVGLIGALALAQFDRAHPGKLALFSTLIITSVMFLYIAPIEAYGWYKYPVYPLIAVGLGYVLWQLYLGKFQYLFLFAPLLAVMLEHSALLNPTLAKEFMLIYFLFSIVPIFLIQADGKRMRPIFLSFLSLLFLFESLWILRLLQF